MKRKKGGKRKSYIRMDAQHISHRANGLIKSPITDP
jgi:hypothetical protein